MAIPVYVQSVTTYPGRTEWSNTADYVVGDRVYYADSISDYSVYVCIQDQDLSGGGTAQQPDLTPNYWRAAGSKEYPFLTGSGGNIYNSNFTGTEFCVRRENSFENLGNRFLHSVYRCYVKLFLSIRINFCQYKFFSM